MPAPALCALTDDRRRSPQPLFSCSPRTVPLFAALTGLLLTTSLACTKPGVQAPDRPNIVLVTIDCLRADRATPDDIRAKLMPNLHRLAAEGTLFEEAVAPAGTTFPSHATMLSGRYPRMHGLRGNDHALPAEVVTAPQLLLDAGYRTGAFVSYKAMLFRGKLHRGFAARSDYYGIPKAHPIRDGKETTEKALSWLRSVSPGSNPFFMWLHLFEPHGPYRLNEYSKPILEQGADGILADGASMDDLLQRRADILDSPDQRRLLAALYDGEVRKADEYLGRILAALDEGGHLANTVVIVTGDHGQALGEHRRLGHGPILWESVMQVPLVIVDFRAPSRNRVSTRVGLVDLAPTILDFARLAPPSENQGRSLIGALRTGQLEDAPYYAEVPLKENSRATWYDPDAVAVYAGPFKLVRRHDEMRLYDLRADSDAFDPIPADQEPHARRYLLQLAESFLAGASQPHRAVLGKEDIEELRSLGYLQ